MVRYVGYTLSSADCVDWEVLPESDRKSVSFDAEAQAPPELEVGSTWWFSTFQGPPNWVSPPAEGEVLVSHLGTWQAADFRARANTFMYANSRDIAVEEVELDRLALFKLELVRVPSVLEEHYIENKAQRQMGYFEARLAGSDRDVALYFNSKERGPEESDNPDPHFWSMTARRADVGEWRLDSLDGQASRLFRCLEAYRVERIEENPKGIGANSLAISWERCYAMP
ncbi:hypothetical protein LG274_12130 [Micrococcus antarcticus]|uniref:hypothetical protein n=1 Tax=Micrococcus antarcticus TaxID=86171 RepID=UPI00384ADAA4